MWPRKIAAGAKTNANTSDRIAMVFVGATAAYPG
jgi:hypothetical protein